MINAMDNISQYKRDLEAFARDYFGDNAPKLVFGEGPTGARLMLVGEAPGAQEEEQGRPFVGKAGKNLDEMLTECCLQREEIYIGNAVKFRPCKSSAAGRIVNRPPTPAEIAAFSPWLMREIAIVSPEIVATLGNTPLRSILGKATTIGELNGRLINTDHGFTIFPMYHPASLIYNPSLRPVFRKDIETLSSILRSS